MGKDPSAGQVKTVVGAGVVSPARDSIKRLALQFYRIEKVSFLTRLRIDLIIQAKEIIGRTFTRRGEKPITGAFECAEALDLDHIGNLNVQ